MLCKKMNAADGASTYSIHFGKALINDLSLPPTNYKNCFTTHFWVSGAKKERRIRYRRLGDCSRLVSPEGQDCAVGENLEAHEFPVVMFSGFGLLLDSLSDFERTIFESDGVNVSGEVLWRSHEDLLESRVDQHLQIYYSNQSFKSNSYIINHNS